MYFCSKTEIVNELGNTILLALEYDERGVTVHAVGPTSSVLHTWTKKEMETILELFSEVMFEAAHEPSERLAKRP